MNTREIYGRGQTYKVTRRFVTRGGVRILRVRVQGWRGMIAFGKPEFNEFRDYEDMCEGDAMYSKHIRTLQERVR